MNCYSWRALQLSRTTDYNVTTEIVLQEMRVEHKFVTTARK